VVLERLARAAVLLGAPEGLAPLRARAALAVLESPGQHHVDLPEGAGARLLATAAEACLRAPLPRIQGGGIDARRDPPGLLPYTRSEALLASAGRLFALRGYSGVSLQEIGEAVGIAGPSIYKHFPSKHDLLAAILSRGNAALWFSLHQALADAADARDALDRLVDSYLAVLTGPAGAVSVLLTAVVSLPDPPRSGFRASQQRYLEEWVALLMRWRGELGEPSARMLVHASFALINGLARRNPTGVDDVRRASARQIGALSRAVLGLPPTSLQLTGQ
jgi:AcrR family transcriptional regulator